MRDILDRRTEGFSQGQRVKTAIARALVQEPNNVLLTTQGHLKALAGKRNLGTSYVNAFFPAPTPTSKRRAEPAPTPAPA